MPVSDVEVVSAQPPRVMLELGRAGAGVVHVYAMSHKPPRFGTIVPRSALDDMGSRLEATPHAAQSTEALGRRVETDLPDKEFWLTAVTVSGDWAAVGGSEQCRRVPAIDHNGLTWERYGNELRLSFAWPADLHEIEAHWEQPGSPPGTLIVTRAGYRERGLPLPLSGEAALVVLYPVVLLPSRRLRGPRQLVEIPSHTVIEYHFTWKRRINPFKRRRVLLDITLTTKQDARITRLELTRSEGPWQPLGTMYGNLVRSYSDLTLLPGQPHRIPVGLPFAGPCWLTCLAPAQAVYLRDPPPAERRLK